MDRQGRRVVLAYAVGLVFALAIMFDRVGPWLASRFEEPFPGASRAMAALVETYDASAPGLWARDFDCALAGSFDPSYKNTYRCSEALLASALGTAPDKAGEGALSPAGQDKAPEAASQAREEQAGSAQAAKVAAAPVAPLTVRPPGKVLVVGDSLAIALAGPMERACKDYEGLSVVAQGKVASGLQNPQYYNWEQALGQFLAEHQPLLVVVMMGANDAKYLTLDPEAEGPVALEDRRAQNYRARLARFLGLLKAKNIPACWVGLPIMGDPELAAKSQALNALAAQTCAEMPNVRYLDIWPLLADTSGNYAHYLLDDKGRRVRVREGDKIHFSAAGGDLIVRRLFLASGLIQGLKHKDGKDLAQDDARPAAQSPSL